MSEEVWPIKQLGTYYKLDPTLMEQLVINKIEECGGPLGSDPRAIIKRPSASTFADPLAYYWTAGFKTYFPSKEIVKAKWPTTWWDAVKERWAPVWFTRKHPIQYTTLNITALIDGIKIPKGGGELVFHVSDPKLLTKDLWARKLYDEVK